MYVYSGELNSFFSCEFEERYKLEGTWPSDAVRVDDDVYNEYSCAREGFRRVACMGYPSWEEIPPPSQEQLIIAADAERVDRINNAREHISLWQTQLQLGMISDADKAKLIEWMHYITALQAVDTSTAPDISWPQQPAE